jgi:hypothetical protein
MKIDYKNIFISGFFLNESNQYSIDLKKQEFTINNQVYQFDSSEVLKTDFDYFFKRSLYNTFFNIEFQLFLNQLAIKTFSKFDLPIYARFQRDKNYLSLKTKTENKVPLIFDKKKSLFNYGVFDYFLSYNVNKFSSPLGSYNFGLGGELLFGEVTFNTRGTYSNSDFFNNQSDASWRYVIDESKYISQVSIGSLNFTGLEFSNFNGINVTNNPVEPRRNYGTIKIFDKTEPNWTVELYINNRLFDIVKADASGSFNFNLPLNYGTTLVELRYYGLSGEFRSEKKLYQTPFNFYQPDEFIYNFSLGKQRITEQNIANFTAGYGLTDWLTTNLGVEYIENSNSDKPIFFSSTSARIMESYLLNFTLAPSTFYKFAINTTYYNQSSFVIDYSRYFNTGAFNPAGFEHKFSIGVFQPMHISGYQFNLRSTYDYTESVSSTINEYAFGISASIFSFNPFLNYSLSNINIGRSFKSQFMDFGFSYSLFAIPTYFTTLRGNLISVRSSFDFETSQLELLSLNFSTNLSAISRLQISHNYNFKISEGNTQLQFQMYFPDFQYSAAASTEFLAQNLVGSIGYNKIISDLDFYQRNQVGKTTAIFRLFVDNNGNDIFDADEELLTGAKIYLGTSVIEYDESGLIKARELNSHTRYDVTINEETIKNPLLVPKYKNFALRTDANPFKIIDIPFYESGEIDGKVYSLIKNYKNPIAGLRITFTNIEDNSKIITSTFNNGSFYYFGLKPGKYLISVDENQLEMLKLKPQKDRYEIEVLPGQFAFKQNELLIELIPK